MHHSTRRCRFLKRETRCQPTGASVWAGIGLTSGGLARFLSTGRVWIALNDIFHTTKKKKKKMLISDQEFMTDPKSPPKKNYL